MHQFKIQTTPKRRYARPTRHMVVFKASKKLDVATRSPKKNPCIFHTPKLAYRGSNPSWETEPQWLRQRFPNLRTRRPNLQLRRARPERETPRQAAATYSDWGSEKTLAGGR